MFKAKRVWTRVAYLWVSGANYKVKFDKITRITEVFKGFSVYFVGWCAYPFIVVFNEVLINKSPKT